MRLRSLCGVRLEEGKRVRYDALPALAVDIQIPELAVQGTISISG